MMDMKKRREGKRRGKGRRGPKRKREGRRGAEWNDTRIRDECNGKRCTLDEGRQRKERGVCNLAITQREELSQIPISERFISRRYGRNTIHPVLVSGYCEPITLSHFLACLLIDRRFRARIREISRGKKPCAERSKRLQAVKRRERR